jgi:hypothetical protein
MPVLADVGRTPALFCTQVGTINDGDHQQRGSPYAAMCPFGFSAQPGFDPASGLGSPNWRVLNDILKDPDFLFGRK